MRSPIQPFAVPGAGILYDHRPIVRQDERRGLTDVTGRRNHERMRASIECPPDRFELDERTNLASNFPGFCGLEGATAFAQAVASEADLFLPPSALWRPSLVTIADDGIRLGLGRLGSGEAPTISKFNLHRSGCR